MRRYVKVVLMLMAMLCCISLTAYATGLPTSAHATLWRNGIAVNGEDVGFINEQEKDVYPISYGGSVYIPLRTAGEWMGCAVVWDSATRSVRLSSGAADPKVILRNDTPPRTDEEFQQLQTLFSTGVTVAVSPDIAVILDGVKQDFVNVNGDPVHPLIYNGSVFLPVRSIGELTGKKVAFVTAAVALPEICIYDELTAEQKQASADFLRRHQALVDQMYSEITALYNATTQAEALVQLNAIDAVASSMQNASIPDVPLFATQFSLLNKNMIQIFGNETSQYRTALLGLSPQAPATEVKAVWGGNGSLIDLRHREHSGTLDYVIGFAEALGVVV